MRAPRKALTKRRVTDRLCFAAHQSTFVILERFLVSGCRRRDRREDDIDLGFRRRSDGEVVHVGDTSSQRQVKGRQNPGLAYVVPSDEESEPRLKLDTAGQDSPEIPNHDLFDVQRRVPRGLGDGGCGHAPTLVAVAFALRTPRRGAQRDHSSPAAVGPFVSVALVRLLLTPFTAQSTPVHVLSASFCFRSFSHTSFIHRPSRGHSRSARGPLGCDHDASQALGGVGVRVPDPAGRRARLDGEGAPLPWPTTTRRRASRPGAGSAPGSSGSTAWRPATW